MRTAYIAALGLVCTVSLAAYAAEPKPHPSSDKSTTEQSTTETTTTDEKSASESKAKHSCPEGQTWQKTCQKHGKNGEKCMKIAWGCSPSPDVPQPAPEPANPLPEEK